MAETVYALCVAMSAACAITLFREYRLRPLSMTFLWSSVCCVGLATNSALLLIDRTMTPNMNPDAPRAAVGALATLVLVVGLVWDER